MVSFTRKVNVNPSLGIRGDVIDATDYNAHSEAIEGLTPGVGQVVVGGEDGPEKADLETVLGEAIAADETVVAAAAAAAETAVDAELVGRDILEGGDIFADYNDPVFAVVDEEDRRSWIEVAPDGGPTARTTEILADRLASVFQEVGNFDESINIPLVAIVDDTRRRSWLEIAADGGPTAYAAERILDALADVTPLPATEYRDPEGTLHPIVSGPDITCLGDSLTAGSGADGTAFTYPHVLGDLTGRTVTNLGVPGETSRTILGRFGGWPMIVAVSGGALPTSGGVTVTLASMDGGAVAPLISGDGGINPCSVAGVEGTLSLSGGVYTFTRSASGAEVPVPVPVALITTAWRTRRDDIVLYWVGANDGWATSATIAAQVIDRIEACIAAQLPLSKRWLVLGPTADTAANRAPVVDLLMAAYGRRFVNHAAYLSTTTALADAGITPTSDDLTAIASGAMPPSLLADAIHFNSAGYGRIANYVAWRMSELGWED